MEGLYNLNRQDLTNVDPSVFIAQGAVVLGDVSIGADSSIWFQVVLRADVEKVTLGKLCNIQDGSILHSDPGQPAVLGDRVSLGHRALVHGALIEDDVLVGIGAMVLNGAVIGHHSIIGAGALVTEGTKIPPFSLVMGMPGRVMREVGSQHLELIRLVSENYARLGQAYRAAGYDLRYPTAAQEGGKS